MELAFKISPKIIGYRMLYGIESKTRRSSNRARKALTASNRHWGYMSIRAVRQTTTERSDAVIPYRIAHIESGSRFGLCSFERLAVCFSVVIYS